MEIFRPNLEPILNQIDHWPMNQLINLICHTFDMYSINQEKMFRNAYFAQPIL